MRHILTTLFLVLGLTAFAQMSAGDFEAVDGKKGDALLDGLNDLIKNHNVISYSSLEPYYERTDFYADTLWDMYSTCRFTMAEANKAQKALCDGWNKEHVVCQSWLGNGPMVSDLFNVYPTDARVNNLRSNYPYGVVANNKGFSKDPNHHALGKLGTSAIAGGGDVVYEPDDRYKGDFARTYFYMVARYRENTLNSGNGSKMFTSNPTNLTAYSLEFLLKWHREDPVSQKEINRNDSVNQIQKKRNPFIDYPYLVEYIWGDLKGEAVDFTRLVCSQSPAFIPDVSDGHVESTDPLLVCNTKILTFPTVQEGGKADLTLNFQGVRLTHGVTISISGANADCFSVSPASIALDAMQANSKQNLKVSYQPTSNAIHKAILTIASQDAKSISVELSGACAVECELLWIVDCDEYNAGDPTTKAPVGGKIITLPTAPESCSATSTQFVGWTQTQIDGVTDDVPADLFSDASEAPVVSGNMRFYAVFSRLTETGGGDTEDITWTPKSQEGWTNQGLVEGSSSGVTYGMFVQGASLTSPEIDYASLGSVVFQVRTYGGTQYNIIDIYAGSTKIGSIDAQNNTMKEVTWTNDKELTGQGPLVFSSTTNTAKNAPAAASITIKAIGKKYVYDQYLTSCGDKCEEPEPEEQAVDNMSVRPAAAKFIRDGQLLIEYEGHIYNIMGVQIQ